LIAIVAIVFVGRLHDSNNEEGLPKTIIITGCDDHYVPLVNGLIDSIEEPARANQLDIGFLDFGLSDDHRSEIGRRGILLTTPEWDFDPTLFTRQPDNHFKAMTSRPHLRKYFPGYDYYLWMDADTWVQDWSGVRLYLSSAETFGFAATPEVDRSYAAGYRGITVISWRRQCFARCFDVRVADKLALFPMINSGVFAGRADAPHWDLWSRILSEIFRAKREPYFFSEQTALNFVIRQAGIRTAFLPSICNWMCNRAMPVCSEDAVELYEPNPPFQRISIVHLTNIYKNGKVRLATTSGKVCFRSLRFGGYDDARIGPNVPLPKI